MKIIDSKTKFTPANTSKFYLKKGNNEVLVRKMLKKRGWK